MNKQYEDFFKALGELRHDNISNDKDALKDAYRAFIRGGSVPDFYLYTLELLLEVCKESEQERRDSLKTLLRGE